ncbi:MAG: hypothetical protein RM338_13355 [Nostoc sp. DedQUE12a]|nr:hypothetical protein [Nostoc sp. DedQUE12a]
MPDRKKDLISDAYGGKLRTPSHTKFHKCDRPLNMLLNYLTKLSPSFLASITGRSFWFKIDTTNRFF